jgi:uncharacterized protein YjbI with pentapeptide repeats
MRTRDRGTAHERTWTPNDLGYAAWHVSSPWPIQVHALAPVACGGFLWRRGSATGVTVVVKATFGLIQEANARLVAPLDIVRDDRHRTDGCLEEASEVAPFLPSAGVLLLGAAHAPAGQAAAAVSVRLGVFRERPLINKVLHVIGHRSRESPASAQPFDTMPLVYDRAFGGVGFEDNPVGTGALPGSPLPNVVDPQAPTRAGGYGPIAKHWGARRRLLGNRPEPRAPEVPDGLEWTWFHAAPADQQIELLRGNEWIVLDGCHPAVPHFRTRLPDVRAHARWHLAGAAGPGPTRTLELSADTLVITPENQVCSLLWRGHVILEHADAARMVAMVGVEMVGYALAAGLSAPSTRVNAAEIEGGDDARHATERIDIESLRAAALPFARSDPARPFAATAPHVQAPAPSAFAGTVSQVTSLFASPLPFHAGPKADEAPEPERVSEPRQARSVRPPFRFIEAGRADDDESSTRVIDVNALASKAIAPFPLSKPGARPEPSTSAIPGAPWSATQAPPSTVEPPAPPATQPPPATFASSLIADPSTVERVPALVELHDAPPLQAEPAVVASLGDPRAAPPGAAPVPAPPVVVEVESAGLRATLVARVAAREPLLDLALAGADLHGLDLTGALLARASLKGAQLAGCKLGNARLSGAQLADADLSDADLSGADLTQADLAHATLTRARFDGAILTDASLDGAQGHAASFVAATATRATFARGSWDGADFSRVEAAGADFGASSAAGARFDGATLTEARFDDVRAAGAVFDRARLAQSRAVGAVLTGAHLLAIDAPGSSWERATLDGASLAGANLKDANLSRASCAGANLSATDLSGANLQRFAGDRADLREAQLVGADLRQAKLHEASFDRAVLRDVSGAKADLERCRFAWANLQGATLRGARLAGATFVHADLEGADLWDADLNGVNVFGASRKTAKLGAGVKGLVEIDPGDEDGASPS